MSQTYEAIEKVVFQAVEYAALAIEIIGALVLVYAVVRGVFGLVRRDVGVRLKLAQGIALSLEFKIGGELLRTIYIKKWDELLILGAVILIRAAMTFLIQWEIKVHRRDAVTELNEMKEINLKKIKKADQKSKDKD